MLFAALIASLSLNNVASTGTNANSLSPSGLLSLISSSRPSNADVAFDCAWRTLALEYASVIQPWLPSSTLHDLFDALEIEGLNCNATSSAALIKAHRPLLAAGGSHPTRTSGATLYVDYSAGSDADDGSLEHPLKTIAAAVAQIRTLPAPHQIVLRNGTHYLSSTINLTSPDSGLSISNYPGESPVISGAVPLRGLTWVQKNRTASRQGVVPGPVLPDTNNVFGECGKPGVPNKGIMPNWQACQSSCLADSTCTSWTYHNGTFNPGFTHVCCWHTDGEWHPRSQAHAISQNVSSNPSPSPTPPPPAVIAWVSSIPPGTSLPDSLRRGGFPALHVGGHRATLARFPNANPELDVFPKGYISAAKWLPPVSGNVSDSSVLIPMPPGQEDGGGGMYINYTMGFGGNAARYDPPQSFWASPHFQPTGRWNEMHLRSPSGLDYGSSLPRAPYGNLSQGVVHSWREHHWFSWMFGGLMQQSNSTAFTFTSGGHQGGEGCDEAAEWWVEGLVEELDDLNEYFFEPATGELWFIPNASDATGAGGAPGSDVVFDIPFLSTFFNLSGTPTAPVQRVLFSGLLFTAGSPTFMDARGVPSGGDWALERNGVILLEGTELVTIEGCSFERVDGNAIFLSGHNRNATVAQSSFSNLGQSAIAAWGKTPGPEDPSQGFNATALEIPLFTLVTGNIAHDIGQIQKQSSFYFQAVTAQATLVDNIVYNIPRAAVNFNDNFGGGAEMSRNLLFNTCRESSDHGVFNSWGRLPYIVALGGEGPSAVPLYNDMHHNFLVANYGADGGCLDNDDGSSYYKMHHNFCPYGGHKTDFDGHSKWSFNNLHVFPSVYGAKCIGILQQLPVQGFPEHYTNNTCILGSNQPVLAANARNLPPSQFALSVLLGNNVSTFPSYPIHGWRDMTAHLARTLMDPLPSTPHPTFNTGRLFTHPLATLLAPLGSQITRHSLRQATTRGLR